MIPCYSSVRQMSFLWSSGPDYSLGCTVEDDVAPCNNFLWTAAKVHCEKETYIRLLMEKRKEEKLSAVFDVTRSH